MKVARKAKRQVKANNKAVRPSVVIAANTRIGAELAANFFGQNASRLPTRSIDSYPSFSASVSLVSEMQERGLAFTLSEAEASENSFSYLIVYQRPERFLTRQAGGKRLARRDLALWLEGTEKILELYRRNRSCSTVVDIDSVHANFSDFAELASRKFGLKLSDQAGTSMTSIEPEPLLLIFSQQIVNQSNDVQLMLRQLEKAEVGLAKKPSSVDVFDVYEKWAKKSDETEDLIKELRSANSMIADENELVIKRCQEAQEDAEKFFFELEELKQRHKRLLGFHKEKKAQVDRLKKEVRCLEKRLRRVESSAWWRLTKPLRKIF